MLTATVDTWRLGVAAPAPVSTLYRRSNGIFYVVYTDPTKRPTRKHVSTRRDSRAEAERIKLLLDAGTELGEFCAWHDDAQAYLNGGTSDRKATRRPRTMGEAASAFLASRSNLQPMTRERYRSIVERFRDHLDAGTSVEIVQTADVQAWIDSTETKPVTANNYRKALSTFFRWLEDEGVREGDPTRKVRLRKVPQKHPRYLSERDVERICSAIEANDKRPHIEAGTGRWLLPIVRANVYLGLRAGEVVNLRWHDLDAERGTLVVRQSDDFTTKAGKDRTLPISDPVRAVLDRLDARGEYVFPNHSGGKLHRQYLSRRFKHFARQAGLPEVINFHSTRHTAASWLAERGVPVEAIRLYLGHSSVSVTQRYMHLAPDVYASKINAAFS